MMSWFFRRRTIICPTWLGWLCLLLIAGTPGLWWWFRAENYLAGTKRLSADVLVVEGWIGTEAVQAAAAEYAHSGAQYVIATGGLTSSHWSDEQWSYAEMAGRQLAATGVPREKIILARASNTENQRTHEMAVAVRQMLEARNIRPKAINVFTHSTHARRSQLIFAKEIGRGTQVGVIGWCPPDYRRVAWWRSSERSQELIKETAGYLFELFFNSGRDSDFLLKPSAPPPREK